MRFMSERRLVIFSHLVSRGLLLKQDMPFSLPRFILVGVHREMFISRWTFSAISSQLSVKH
jgi:hypothetical protein